jgi:hypothetical protein
VTDSDPLPQTGPSDALTGSLPRPPVRTEVLSLDQAITLRDQAPELYDLWLKIAQEKAATANYVDRAPYEIPERLAQAGRPRALGALIVVLSFCGYLAWLGGPGPYIGGLIALVDLAAMLGIFFGLRPDRLSEPRSGNRTSRPDHGGLAGRKPLPAIRPQTATASIGRRPPPATGATATTRHRPGLATSRHRSTTLRRPIFLIKTTFHVFGHFCDPICHALRSPNRKHSGG